MDASTGSLGHGLSMALGMALGARFQKQGWRTYCLLGDGECDEGSVWEAAMAAHHFKADNLTAFVDRNHMMIDGLTEDVMSLEPLADKWAAFGWQVRQIDGHDLAQIGDAIEGAQATQGGAHRHHLRHRQGQGRRLHGGRGQVALRVDRL